jgi:hypothetical protein
MKKTPLWVGLVNGQFGFFASDPVDNVQGLQGSRKFYVEGNQPKIVDDNGTNLIDNTTLGGGANSSDISTQTAGHAQNEGPTGQQEQTTMGQQSQGGQVQS